MFMGFLRVDYLNETSYLSHIFSKIQNNSQIETENNSIFVKMSNNFVILCVKNCPKLYYISFLK